MKAAHEGDTHFIRHSTDRSPVPYPAGRQIAHPGFPVAFGNEFAFHAANVICEIDILGASHRRRQMRKAEAFPACEKFFLMLHPKGAECQLCRRPFTLEDDGAQDESCQKALMQIGTCAPSI